MKVIHVIPALFSNDDGVLGGAERYVFELAKHMAHAVPTELITFGAREREERCGPLRIHVIGRPWHVRGQRTNPFAFRLLRELSGASVVHCHQPHILASTVSAIASRLAGRLVVCSDLGGGGWDLSSYVSTDRLFNAHLHISEYSRRVAGHEGRPWAHVIWGGVDTDTFSPEAVPHTGGRILFVGRILPHKGIDTLIRALPPDLEACIIGPLGDERYLADLRALADGKNVTFRHDCNDGDLVAAYRAALCVVLPSVYDDMYGNHTEVPELLGQTLLEGMSCGRPTVATSVASLPEIVEEGVTGLLVPQNDPRALRHALVTLAGNSSLAQRMGTAGRARVRSHFTWSLVVERCLAIYREGLDTSRLGRFTG